jgi:hypothetical protein
MTSECYDITDSIKYAMVAVVDYYSAIEDYLEEGNE